MDLSTQLYAQGQIEFLNVLDTQRSLFAAEDSLVRSTSNLSTDLVALYKALGGGWEEESPVNVKDDNTKVKSEPNSPAKPNKHRRK